MNPEIRTLFEECLKLAGDPVAAGLLVVAHQHKAQPAMTPAAVASDLSTEEAAAELGCSIATIYRMITQGKLANYRVGTGRGKIRIRRSALDDYKRMRQPAEILPIASFKHLSI